MTKENLLKYIELYDELQDTCNTIASIFAKVDNTFLTADGWQVTPPYMTCTGHHEPGYVFCASPAWSCIHIPFMYLSMSEEELRETADKRPEEIKAMVEDVFDIVEDAEDDDSFFSEHE